MTLTFITGANKGLGHETARRLVQLGHTVVLGARDVDRGTAAAAEVGARFVQIASPTTRRWPLPLPTSPPTRAPSMS